MKSAKMSITQVWFVNPLPLLNAAYIGTGPEWRDCTVALDRDTREVLVVTARHGRIRVPLENVRCYQLGATTSVPE